MICPTCGHANTDLARFCQTCGGSLERSSQSAGIESAADPIGHDSYSGFFRRLFAFLVDWIVVGTATGLVLGLSTGSGALAVLAVPWLYEALMLASERQATLGKIALGLVVTDDRGGRLSFGRATGRHFSKYLSALVLGIGFLMAAFTARRQALHDLIAGTLVLHHKFL